MRILVDSHILYWSIIEPKKISATLGQILVNGDNQIWASAAGIAELRIKQRIGKLELPDDFDGLIAATAMIHGHVLVTRNVRDIEQTGVNFINPFNQKKTE